MTLEDKYTRPAIVLHWLIALAIAINSGMMLVYDDEQRTRTLVDLHKSIGITMLGMVLLRILWRIGHQPPALPTHYKPWERALAHGVHGALYLIILAVPLTGWLHDSAWKGAPTHPLSLFGTIPWFRIPQVMAMQPIEKEHFHKILGEWHAQSAYLLYALFFAHVLGALKHQLFDREKELQRMWF